MLSAKAVHQQHVNCLINTWVFAVKTSLLIASGTAFYAIINIQILQTELQSYKCTIFMHYTTCINHLKTKGSFTSFGKGALAIRRIFSLVDRLQNLNFQIALIYLKLDCFGSKICIESIKIGFKAIHHLQSCENLRLLLPPLILRL